MKNQDALILNRCQVIIPHKAVIKSVTNSPSSSRLSTTSTYLKICLSAGKHVLDKMADKQKAVLKKGSIINVGVRR